jgi:phosphate transport system permease protein
VARSSLTVEVTNRPPAGDAEVPVRFEGSRTREDEIFRWLCRGAAASVLVMMGLIGLFLCLDSRKALKLAGFKFLTREVWYPDGAGHVFGVKGVLLGTILVALIGLVAAVPLAIACALAINEYAPRRLRRPLTGLIDLLAALPSLIYGLWGKFFLQPRLLGISKFLADHLAFIPMFRADPGVKFGYSMFVAGVVIGLMILPIITSISREVMSQVPRDLCEAAYALGGTRWAMVREVVLPFGRNGIIGGAMLGLGRALGETIAVAVILSADYKVHMKVLEPGGGTVAGLIANTFGNAGEIGRSALAAAGLALFVLTLIVNAVARLVVTRTTRAGGRDL